MAEIVDWHIQPTFPVTFFFAFLLSVEPEKCIMDSIFQPHLKPGTCDIMVVNEIEVALRHCQEKRPHKGKAFPPSSTFSFLSLSSSLGPEEVAVTLSPWGEKHDIKRLSTKEDKAERKKEPSCLMALLSHCAGPGAAYLQTDCDETNLPLMCSCQF